MSNLDLRSKMTRLLDCRCSMSLSSSKAPAPLICSPYTQQCAVRGPCLHPCLCALLGINYSIKTGYTKSNIPQRFHEDIHSRIQWGEEQCNALLVDLTLIIWMVKPAGYNTMPRAKEKKMNTELGAYVETKAVTLFMRRLRRMQISRQSPRCSQRVWSLKVKGGLRVDLLLETDIITSR